MIRFDYVGFVKDYIHVHARMKNYIIYIASKQYKKEKIQKRIKTK